MQEKLKILIVDDDEVDRIAVRRALKTAGVKMDVSEAENYSEAIEQLLHDEFDCAFIDYRLPDKDGLALVREIRDHGVKIPLIALTGQGDEQIAVELMKAGASDYLSKFRISPLRLNQALQTALRLYQAEREMAIATAQKEELAKQREDFVSRMTHDLRTPLVAANRMLGLFQEGMYGEIPGDMDKAIHVIIRSNQNLLEMVNNLLEVYCHESGEKRLTFTGQNILEIIEEVQQELTPLATEKGIELSLNASEEGRIHVIGDRLELRRVFTNLIGNAIKFTDEGYVRVNFKPASENDPLVTIEIEDTGSGIPDDELPQLFERFRHGKHRRSTSGLGLYLSRRIIDAHQGSITVASEVDKGSTFRVRIPARMD
jgi:signal transduction histidine kinase